MSRGGAADEEEPESAVAAAGAARGKVVSAMMRKHLVESMVPVLVDLKRLLEAGRHPLLSELMATLRALLKDHKHEVGHPWSTNRLSPAPHLSADALGDSHWSPLSYITNGTDGSWAYGQWMLKMATEDCAVCVTLVWSTEARWRPCRLRTSWCRTGCWRRSCSTT